MYIDWQSNGLKRLYTGLALVVGLVIAFALRLVSVWIFDVVVMALIFLSAWEMMRVRKSAGRGVEMPYVFSYIIIAYIMFVIGVVTSFSFLLHIVMQLVTLIIFGLYVMLMNYMDKDFSKRCNLKKITLGKGTAQSGLEFLKVAVYPVILLFVLIPLNHLGSWTTVVPDGASDPINVSMIATFGLILVFMISCFTDTFAYLVGLTLKGPKLCPKISPKKTISGAIGGLFGGMVGALLTILIFIPNGSVLQTYLTQRIGGTVEVQCVITALGLVGSIVTQLGGICASVIKRKAGVKDYGNYLPGHGGAMDRLDGVAFNSMLVFVTFLFLVFI